MGNQLKCSSCQQYTHELFGMFVPYLCKKCYEKEKNEQIRNGNICTLCGNPYIDCCC